MEEYELTSMLFAAFRTTPFGSYKDARSIRTRPKLNTSKVPHVVALITIP
jgi:hypothetical protein